MESKYYDGTKLLSLLDIDGNKPEIYICTSNRSAGKTTWFNRYVVRRYLRGKGKFCLIYRYKYELQDCAEKFFKEIGALFFPDYTLTQVMSDSKAFVHLMLAKGEADAECCGYAVALNSAEQVKKYSHYLNDTTMLLFDEFQSETGVYCANEMNKFISIHKSIARGGGEQSRYVPVIMISNPVSVLNPYYSAMGISSRLNDKVKFMRGHGFVLEQGYNESAAKAQAESGFSKAFCNTAYIGYSDSGKYLSDNQAFIEEMTGKNVYLCTIKYHGNEYGVREYPEADRNGSMLYCSPSVDQTHPIKITVNTDDHDVDYILGGGFDSLVLLLRHQFEMGRFRFKNIESKEALIKTISC